MIKKYLTKLEKGFATGINKITDNRNLIKRPLQKFGNKFIMTPLETALAINDMLTFDVLMRVALWYDGFCINIFGVYLD